jgi:uncharacterized caspase-like protein
MKLIVFFVGLCFVACTAFAQQKEQRVALVIGNSTYKSSPLKNPANDALDISLKLKNLNFEVITKINLTTKQIGGALREFKGKLSPGAVALFFYAGHGLQIKGENYFPTVDADISAEEDVPNQSLSTKQLMSVLEDSKTRLNLVFLDACRDNPYARSFRNAGGGLAKLDAPSGTLISFATRPGSVASDGAGKNGLYTENLLKIMDLKNMPIEQALKQVVKNVKTSSNGRQEPWMEGSIEGDFYFITEQDTSLTSTGRPPASSQTTTLETALDSDSLFWAEVKANPSKEYLNAYLLKFPKGRYIELAKIELNFFEPIEKQLAVDPKPPQPSTAQSLSLNLLSSTPNLVKVQNEGSWTYQSFSGASPFAGGSLRLKDGKLQIFAGNLNPCWTSPLPAEVERNLTEMVITVQPKLRGCLPTRFRLKIDGSGGVREEFIKDEWIPDGKDRLLTAIR